MENNPRPHRGRKEKVAEARRAAFGQLVAEYRTLATLAANQRAQEYAEKIVTK